MTRSISEQLQTLLQIQDIDQSIAELQRARIEQQNRIDEVSEKLAGIEARLQQLQEQRQTLQVERDRLQLEADEEQERILNYEKRIRDIRNDREYQALSREISASKKARADAEEQALAIMQELESLEADIATVEEERAGVQSELDELRATLADLETEVEAKAAPQQQERDKLAGAIDRQILARYEMVRKRFANAVVFAEGETCRGCNRRIPPQQFNQVLRESAIVVCASCKRILAPPSLKPTEAAEAAAETVGEGAATEQASN
ncbi:MAG: hypothetical protein D6761_06310 [Candidatus Dadabacteria bacterium]|nr:MAG: hypothetical protein D6761_06310 [Candidatus Dadabacteria bacterium]